MRHLSREQRCCFFRRSNAINAALPVWVLALFPCMLLCSVVTPLFSATSIPLDLPVFAQQADIIADVNVVSLESYWATPAGEKAIRTRVTFTINKLLKGAVSSPFSLDLLGGTVGGRTVQVPGIPQLAIGQRLIIFAHGPGNAYVSPFLGVDQGVLRVIRDQATNTDRVLRWWGQPVNESQDFKSRVAPSPLAAADQLRSANSVDEFSQQVSKMLNQ